MAIDAYMVFVPYQGAALKSESQVDFKNNTEELADPFKSNAGAVFEVESYSFDVEQVLNIGSQSTGAGAGKIAFNPFKITRKIDKSSPTLFANACSGTAFKQVILGLRKSGGGDTAGSFFLRFDFKLVAVKSINWSSDSESPTEDIEFEYGGLQVRYTPQKPDGKFDPVIASGWNKVKNISDVSTAAI